jgi:mono/diheme cytochrome c family protein
VGHGGGGGGPPAAGRGGLGNAGMGTTFTPDFTPQPPVLPKTPAEELEHFILKPGYKMELVLSDPDIAESTAVAFDGNGRMYVLEDRGYMNDVNATGTRDPVGRISRHEDLNGDGVYEKHTVFVDNLVFPRFVMPFGKDSILTAESDHDEVWKFTDTDGDGKADKQELFATGFGNPTNVEWQTGFLTWTLDNWLYSTVNAFRVRWTPNGLLKEATGSNGSHWGVTQDNDGKQWFQASATGLPGYFQFPIEYGNFNYPDQYLPSQAEFLVAWGAPVRVADMQGGVSSVRMPDGSLNSMTGAAGNDIVRAHRMPADLQGDYIYGEPVGRMLRRSKVSNNEGLTQLKNAHLYDEFVKSTDPLFRPVDITTAPDGTLYITDMYRGIIQEAQFLGLTGAQPSYIKQRIDQYQLDKVTDHGRIWRLSYEGMPRDKTVPKMLNETPAQLVTHLSHPNGWWRDTAQQLLVLKQDKSVVPALQKLARQKSADPVPRFHALWTLEGLGALDAALTRDLLGDSEPRVRRQAIRASETLYKAGDKSFAADYARLTKDANNDVAIQAVLTVNTLKVADAETTVKAAQETNKSKGMQLVASQILTGGGRGGRGGGGGAGMQNLTPAEQASVTRGQQIYSTLCVACHGPDGNGIQIANQPPGAPALANNLRVAGHRDYALNAIVHGLNGPIAGTTYTNVMVPMKSNSDQWIADVASYIRTSFNNSSAVRESDVARIRANNRAAPWTFVELDPLVPKNLPTNGWKATSSHSSATAVNGLGLTQWSSGTALQSGMWYQVELTEPANLTEVEFTVAAPGSGRGGPGGPGGGGPGGGGGGGRGGARGGPGAGGPGGGPGVGGAGPASGGAGPVAVAAGGPGGTPPGATPAVAAVSMEYAPRAYRVEVSLNGADWTAVATGEGKSGVNNAAFTKATQARFLRVTATEVASNSGVWSIQSFRLLVAGGR